MSNIGSSTIFSLPPGFDFYGPTGSTGNTGATGNTGPTGSTGIDSNYIVNITTNSNNELEFLFSDGIIRIVDEIKGPTGIYAGLTAFSLGNGLPIFKGICGGITLDFYNIRADGLLGTTYDSNGNLVFTIQKNNVPGESTSLIPDRVIYVKDKQTVSSTNLITKVTNSNTRLGNTDYGYVDFSGETAGRSLVADIKESILSVGPIFRGEKTITLDNFYETSENGITLDVSKATVYHITTPIGIKALKNDPIPTGSILSVTLIVEGDDVWNFPENIYFDESSNPIFYPGTNILHLTKYYNETFWRANFTARGFGVDEINNPGVFGSCCYLDIDDKKICEDYVTQAYCLERNGYFAPSSPCNKNPCITESETGSYDGICCSEGRCISDLDPSLCQTIGGYFISGITCGGDNGVFPENENTTNIGELAGLCYNKCKDPSICCKDGECLGQITEPHCRLLGGTIVAASNCAEARCCDHITAPSACCKLVNNEYSCTDVLTPYECKSIGGIYMGKNTKCEGTSGTGTEVRCDCRPQTTTECYECGKTQISNLTNSCQCNTVIITDGRTCEENNYYSTIEQCQTNCSTYVCHQCDGINCIESSHCEPCQNLGLQNGPCVINETCQTKTCFSNCVNCSCNSISDIPVSQSCPPDFPNSSCDNCNPDECDQHVACFWCFPESKPKPTTCEEFAGNSSFNVCDTIDAFGQRIPSTVIAHRIMATWDPTNEFNTIYVSWPCTSSPQLSKVFRPIATYEEPFNDFTQQQPYWNFKFTKIDSNRLRITGRRIGTAFLNSFASGSPGPGSTDDQEWPANFAIGNIIQSQYWTDSYRYSFDSEVRFGTNPSGGNFFERVWQFNSLNYLPVVWRNLTAGSGNFSYYGYFTIWVGNNVNEMTIIDFSTHTISGASIAVRANPCYYLSEDEIVPTPFSLSGREIWRKNTTDQMQAPYRAVTLVNNETKNRLEQQNFQLQQVDGSYVFGSPTTISLPGLVSGSTPRNIQVFSDSIPFASESPFVIHYFEETNLVSNTQIESSDIRTSFGPNPFQPGIPNINPTSINGKFKCYYVGSYQYDSKVLPNNRTRCLQKFLPNLSAINYSSCKLCDFVEPFSYNMSRVSSEGQVTDFYEVDSVEPYSIVKLSALNAPFPPLWGRMTYGFDYANCNSYFASRQTCNLKLMTDEQIVDMCLKTRNGNLMGYMNDIIQTYSSNSSGRDQVLSNMTTGLSSAMTSFIYVGGVKNESPPNQEKCLKLPYVEYDPYLMSGAGVTGNGGSPSGFTLYGINYKYPFSNIDGTWSYPTSSVCGCLPVSGIPPQGPIFNNDWVKRNDGWYLPYYKQRICSLEDVPPDYPNWFDMSKIYAYYYPPKNELLNLTGEIYYYKPQDIEPNDTTLEVIPPPRPGTVGYPGDREPTSSNLGLGGAPRGIFGRNLRYNLDQYRTASVFWHNNGQGLVQTMPYTELGSIDETNMNVSIPINYVNGWYSETDDCYQYPDERMFCGNSQLCQNGECGNGTIINAFVGSSSGGFNSSNWFWDVGLIAPSTRPTQALMSTSIPKITNNSDTQYKTVKISEGICVNMLCPECNNYELC